MLSTNLKKYNYKTRVRKTPDDTPLSQQGWWFTGGGSFMSNGYVIYKNGLEPDLPNPNGLLQGATYLNRMFDNPIISNRSSLGQLINQLNTMADVQAANEAAFLSAQLDELYKNPIDVDYLNLIRQAIKVGQYSMAFTLLLRRDKDLGYLKSQLMTMKSFQKSQEFFNADFKKYLQDKLESQLTAQQDQGLNIRKIDFDQSFEEFVDNYFSERLGVNVIDNPTIAQIRNTIIQGLQNRLKSNSFKLYNGAAIKDGAGVAINQHLRQPPTPKQKVLQMFLRKDGKFRTPKSIADKIAQDIIGSIGQGLTHELYQIGSWESLGGNAASTGRTQQLRQTLDNKTYHREGKDDVRVVKVFDATLQTDGLFEELYGKQLDAAGNDFYNELEKLVKLDQYKYAGDFFEIKVNAKGYKSNYDLQIEGSGTFAQRLNVLNKIQLDGNMVNKLIFMLNNTTKGCIAEGREGDIASYLSAVCVAWMWDDPQELFDISEENLNSMTGRKVTKVYLFNSGGAYFTASQILRTTTHALLAYLNDIESDSTRLVNVTINPPKPYGNYMNLRNEKYPVHHGMPKDEWEEMLQKRWDEVKGEALQSGTLSIRINQKILEQMLGELNGLLKTMA